MSSGATASRRYRGSTKESTSSKARAIESALMNKARQGKLTGRMKSATLAEFSLRFLDWVDGTRLEAKTKRYYHTGWKLLVKAPISKMRIGHVTTDEAEVLRFDHSPANANCAFRTLRRMLGKAAEWGLIGSAPRIKLLKEEGRSTIIDAESAVKLLAVAKQPLRDVAMIVLDCGMRPSEVFEARWENVDWDNEVIFVPRGKTKRSRRFIPMSNRVRKALLARRGGQTSGWIFPSDSGSGHTITVAKAFQTARKDAGLPQGDRAVLRAACVRHTAHGVNRGYFPGDARHGSFKRPDRDDLPAS